MKVNNTINPIALNPPTFKGFRQQKLSGAACLYEFNYPFDDKKYDCYLELFTLTKDEKGNYNVARPIENLYGETSKPLKTSAEKINLKLDYGLNQTEPFAYRYKLVDKNSKKSFYRVDAGTILDYSKGRNFDKFNIVTPQTARQVDGGAMLLALPDSYNVGLIYNENGDMVLNKSIQKKAQNSLRVTSNKMGGTLAGLEADIPNLKKVGYTRLITTPIFTEDSLSSHSYWNKNCMQMSEALGHIENYETFQQKLFSSGINFVSDGAFVNEGLEGVHFKHVLKWGEKSPFYYWFKADSLKDKAISMGIFAQNKKFLDYKLVNSPYKYTQNDEGKVYINKNYKYNAHKPTYLQIFDSRLVDNAQKTDLTTLITSYEKPVGKNEVEINTHDDTINPYSFEISPKRLQENIERLVDYNYDTGDVIKLKSLEGLRFISKSEKFDLEDKIEGGFETWDANTDIAKLNFVPTHSDTKIIKKLPPEEQAKMRETLVQKNFEVQDYAVTSGRYWTKKTNDILMLYVAKMLGNVDENNAPQKIKKLINEGKLPEKLKNTLSIKDIERSFNHRNVEEDYDKFLLKSLMEVPFDSVEFGDEITAVLASPYMTKRAKTAEEVGQSRYERFLKGNETLNGIERELNAKTDSLYIKKLLVFAKETIDDLNDNLPIEKKITEGGKLTLLGEYVIPLLAGDIVKYALVKALSPNSVDENIKYDYDNLRKTTLADLKIFATSPEDEASALITKLGDKISKLSDTELVENLTKKTKDTTPENFALSKLIIDRANAGLDWRIDAAKDIADIDGVRSKTNNFGDSWDNVIGFWKKFSSAILEENPNSYLVAEITDEHDLYDVAGRFSGATDAVQKFLHETGMTTLANYSYFFTDIANMFSKDFTKGFDMGSDARKTKIFDKLTRENYLNSAPLNSILYSYNFVGNHDKPRILHCAALDMEIFHSNFTTYPHKKLAASILRNKFYDQVTQSDIDAINFERVNGKTIAMADALRGGFGKAISTLYVDKDATYATISRAISEIASGNYLGKPFAPDAFGVKPIDVALNMVIKQAEYYGLNLDKPVREKLYNAAFENTLRPAMTKATGMMAFLAALPGNPTLYAGDDLGLTGYEEKSKNVYQQNRTALHWEWLDDGNKKFIKEFAEKMDSIMSLRSRKELKPLNDGAPFVLELQKDLNGNGFANAILRQSTDGAMAISLFNPSGINVNKDENFIPKALKLDSISLHSHSDKSGVPAGLPIGTTFKNADSRDKSLYKVCENGGNYFLKRFDSEDDYQNFINAGADKFVEHNKIDMFDATMTLYSEPKRVEPQYIASLYLK